MKTYIGLLRAVNVVGRNAVAMTELRALLTKLGMHDVQTLLQSGNVVFRTPDHWLAKELEAHLEAAVAKKLGVNIDCFVRTRPEWKKLIVDNPFPIAAAQDPSHLLVMVLRDAPPAAALTALRNAIAGKGREMVQTRGRHAYLVYPDGVGRSRMTSNLIEKHLATRGTARNWNTVLKLAAACA
jgi:uncharacterized protein (DUF1697 family)